MKILIVDDEMPIRQWFVYCLEKSGRDFNIVGEAPNGKVALEIFRKELPDVVISDIQMPVMNGIEFIKEAKAINPSADFIILTCHAEFDYARQALKYGIEEYILKTEVTDKNIIEILDKIENNRNERKKSSEAIKQPNPLQIESLFEEIILEKNIREPEYCQKSFSSSIKKAIQYINENYEQPISLDEIAKYIHFNSSYFSHIFKEQTGENFSIYLMNFRLQKAEELLKNTDMKISQIAEKVGFINSSHFSRIFKKYRGINPIKLKNN